MVLCVAVHLGAGLEGAARLSTVITSPQYRITTADAVIASIGTNTTSQQHRITIRNRTCVTGMNIIAYDTEKYNNGV